MLINPQRIPKRSLKMSIQTKLTTGDGRNITVGGVAQIYKDINNQAIPKSGTIQRLSDDCFSLRVDFSTTDVDNQESVKTTKVYSLSSQKKSSVKCVSDHIKIADVLTATSENGRYLARLENRIEGSQKKQLLEIWERSKLLKTLNVTDTPVNTDEQFASLQWSRFDAQDKLLFVCQPKKPKSRKSFFEEEDEHNPSERDAQVLEKANCGEEFIRKEDWGECLYGIEHTLVRVLDVGAGFTSSDIHVPNYSLAHSQWLSSEHIISVAYVEDNRVGPIYCNNRPSCILVHNLSNLVQIVVQRGLEECYHTVRVNNAGDKFLYLANPVYGTHIHASQLYIYDVKKESSQQLVDNGKSDFFVEGIPEFCFTSDDKNFLFVHHESLQSYITLCNIEELKFKTIRFPTTGLSVLDFKHNLILATGSEINATPTLFVAILDIENTDGVVAWHQIEDCIHLNDIDYELLTMRTEDGTASVSGILVKPNLEVMQEDYNPLDMTDLRTKSMPQSEISKVIEESKMKLLTASNDLPTVVIIHGGPCATFLATYTPILVLYARLGLNSLLINYRGSSGVTEEHSKILMGKAGEMDVDDCLHIIRELVKDGQINAQKLAIHGGSHSGFIGCHLSCQDEFKFTSAILRNPVVDIGSLLFTSDIPDWSGCYALGQERYDPSWLPSPEEMQKIDDRCPIRKASKANVPTLMLLGTKDRRVNMYQGEQWYNILRARGVDTLCKVYHGIGHDLNAKPDVAIDSTLTGAVWILSHLPKPHQDGDL